MIHRLNRVSGGVGRTASLSESPLRACSRSERPKGKRAVGGRGRARGRGKRQLDVEQGDG